MASNESNSPKNKDFWAYVEENYQEVSTWPKWMRGEGVTCQVNSHSAAAEEPRDFDNDQIEKKQKA